MRRLSGSVLILGILMFLSSCNLPKRQLSSFIEEAAQSVTPVLTETSPFAPLLTPTPTPTLPSKSTSMPVQKALVTPTVGLLTGLQRAPLAEGRQVTLTSFDMFDLQTGWGEQAALEEGFSGYLLHTQDGGLTWQDVTPPAGYPAGSRFFALDGAHAWVALAAFWQGESVEAGYVWRTSDGGATWQASTAIQPQVGEASLLESFSPQAMHFLDKQRGWLVVAIGHYMHQDVLVILATEDGGLTWRQQTDKFSMGQGNGAAMPCRVSGIAFRDPQMGYLAGDCLAVSVDDGFSILTTPDGGRTWQTQNLPEPAGMPQAVRAASPGQERFCAASGVENTPAGILVQHTCQILEGSGMMKNYYFLSLLPADGGDWRGWVGEQASFSSASEGICLEPQAQDGTRNVKITADGGRTWQIIGKVTWQGARLDFPTTTQGFALAWSWNNDRPGYEYALVRSENGGRRWGLVEGVVKSTTP